MQPSQSLGSKIIGWVYQFLTVTEGAACRRLSRRWDREGAFHVHALLLEWFHLPRKRSDWQWDEKSVPPAEDTARAYEGKSNTEKALRKWAHQVVTTQPDRQALTERVRAAQKRQIVRVGMALHRRGLVLPDWRRELLDRRSDPYALTLPDGTWGMRLRDFFETHCGFCGTVSREVASTRGGAMFTANDYYGSSWICRPCVDKHLERISDVMADGVSMSVLRLPVDRSMDQALRTNDTRWSFRMFRHHCQSFDRDFYYMRQADTRMLRQRHQDATESVYTAIRVWNCRRDELLKQAKAAAASDTTESKRQAKLARRRERDRARRQRVKAQGEQAAGVKRRRVIDLSGDAD